MSDLNWVVVENDLSGVPYIMSAPTKADAIEYFMRTSYTFIHVAAEHEFKVVGHDDDPQMTGLHLLMKLDKDWVNVLSVSQVATIVSEKSNYTKASHTATFLEAAALIDGAIQSRKGQLNEHEIERMKFSDVAAHFYEPCANVLAAEKVSHHLKITDKTLLSQIWSDMEKLRHQVSFINRIGKR